MRKSKGVMYIVGAGPGHPELISVRGRNALQIADVILYDNLISEKLLEFCSLDPKKIYVGKFAGKHTLSQKEINDLLVQFVKENKIVVRLKRGEPFIFERGSEEVQFLTVKGVEFEIIPKITSALDISDFVGIPLMHRGSMTNVFLLTTHENLSKKSLKSIGNGLQTQKTPQLFFYECS